MLARNCDFTDIADVLEPEPKVLGPDPGPGPLALFLDLDGTLLDIVLEPHLVRAPDGLVPLLARLSEALEGALAIITGRTIVDVDRLLDPLRLPAAGVHGAEMRLARSSPVAIVAELEPGLVDAVREIARDVPGLVVEPKRYSVAVHYRLAPAERDWLAADLGRLVAQWPDDIVLCQGRKVLEIVPRGVSKGAALAALMQSAPFAGRRPVMIGDDATDETALAAAARLSGLGLRVAGEHFGARAELAGPPDVRAWLTQLAQRLEA